MNTLANRYAQAFFDLAAEHKTLSAVQKDMTQLKKIIETSPDFSAFLKSPIIPVKEAENVFSALSAKGDFHKLTAQFLGILAQNCRKALLPRFLEVFEEILKKQEKVITASITSARKLQKKQRDSLMIAIEKKLKATIELQEKIDPEILGGVIVRFGPYLIDTSLKTQLSQLQKELRG